MIKLNKYLFAFLIYFSVKNLVYSQCLIDCNSFNSGSYFYELTPDRSERQLDSLEGYKTTYISIVENHNSDSVKIYKLGFIDNNLRFVYFYFNPSINMGFNLNEIVSDGFVYDTQSYIKCFALNLRISKKGDDFSAFVPDQKIVNNSDPKKMLSIFFNKPLNEIVKYKSRSGLTKADIFDQINRAFYEELNEVTIALRKTHKEAHLYSVQNYLLIKYYQVFKPFKDDILKYSEGYSFSLELDLMQKPTSVILEFIKEWENNSKLPYIFTAYKVLYFRHYDEKYLKKYQEFVMYHEKMMQEDPINYKAVLGLE
jgi:hypothetical protein